MSLRTVVLSSAALVAALSIGSACATGQAAGPSTTAPAGRPLRATLDAHLAAVNARDLDALLATVTSGESLTLILPSGNVLTTREQYRQLHVDWFAETDWRMVFEVKQVRELGDTGIALVKYQSQAKQADSSYQTQREALLSLVFAREAGAWRLVYDQNTVIPPPEPSTR